jgi:hypothetical protein
MSVLDLGIGSSPVGDVQVIQEFQSLDGNLIHLVWKAAHPRG